MTPGAWILLACGFVTLGLLWLGPLPRLATESFSAHMTMHMGVVAVAAPLLACGVNEARPPQVTGRFAPAMLASVVELIVVWGWHAPALHHAARSSTLGLVLEQGTFLASAFAVWFLAVRGGADAPASAGAGVIALLLTSMHMTLLGALIGLSPRALYAHLPAIGDALGDQHLGGAIMLLLGGVVYLAGGVVLAARLVRDPRPIREPRA
jgi:putative membrane protein